MEPAPGKTTLLTRVTPICLARASGSVIKHAHPRIYVDIPGKGFLEHRQAGAVEVLVSSGKRWALMHELRGPRSRGCRNAGQDVARRSCRRRRFQIGAASQDRVHRAANGKALFVPRRRGDIGIATDTECKPRCPSRISMTFRPSPL